MIDLDPKTTALVLIDLQKGILARPLAPHSADEIIAHSKALADLFRTAGAPVFLVHVGFSENFADAPAQKVDQPMQLPRGKRPNGWTDFVDGLAAPGDLTILKRQWGAFYGTELELQLRRRSVTTLALGGVSTNFGVESTARQGWEIGFDIVLVKDCCASHSAELHDMAISHILPRLSRVVASADLVFAGA